MPTLFLNKFIKIAFFLFFFVVFLFSSTLKVYFLDVKEGDAIFIITPSSRTVLIDAGHDHFRSGEYIYDFIVSKNFDKIDFLIISHPHRDHIGGVNYLLFNTKIVNFYDPEIFTKSKIYYKMLDTVKTVKKVNYFVIKEGDNINIDSNLETLILNPPKGYYYSSINDNSVVMKITYKKISFLFTGDIEEKAEKDIISRYNRKILKSDVLKVPHHGSRSSSTKEFIKAVSPKIAVISCGINNRYGHPHLEVLERYKKYNIKILRTDLDGIIEIITDGETLKINTYKKR
ncbi:MAG: ComEC/Rec2 family competence protein [Elusimicrobiota bacterium]|nr:MBL fold metallo-hydrolase [Endomicrobiia bacterium]MDW8165272.1 ComEC/Rec2 family competence protein [Elusimicrobiota bacterium]